MLIGYARTSTVDQEASFEAQQSALVTAGCEKVFAEQISAVASKRPELSAALDFVREGDALVVTKLDRLARSLADLMELMGTLEARGTALRVLDMNLDTSTATGRLMVGVIGSVAAFERELMLERQRVGIVKAKAEGRYKGRAPTARRKTGEVLGMLEDGKTAVEVARVLGISRSSVERIKRDARDSV